MRRSFVMCVLPAVVGIAVGLLAWSLTRPCNGGEVTTDPIRATVQVRYRQSAGSGTAIGPKLILTCAHIFKGEPVGDPFIVQKHWADGTDDYQGTLLAHDFDLDLALIGIGNADLDYAALAVEDPATPQQASWYGHAAAKPEILSFKGFIARGYSTSFDIVRGHDSIEGQSGGGVFLTGGSCVGVMHGRPNIQPRADGGGIFTPLRRIRNWLRTSCNGPRCQPYLPPRLSGGGQSQFPGQVTPPPSREPTSPVTQPATPPRPTVDLGPIVARLDALTQQLDALKPIPGPPGAVGPRGPPGPIGATPVVDTEAIAKQVADTLPPFYVQVVGDDGQPLGPPTAVGLGGTLNLHHRIVNQAGP